MKKTYTKPSVEVSAVSSQDILNTSADATICSEGLFKALGYFI